MVINKARFQIKIEWSARAIRRLAIIRGAIGLLPYLAATVLAFLSPYLSLAICAAVAGYYASPHAAPGGSSAGA